MDRRHFCRLLLGAPAVAAVKAEPKVAQEAGKDPPHECVDRPTLPCPACIKAGVYSSFPIERSGKS